MNPSKATQGKVTTLQTNFVKNSAFSDCKIPNFPNFDHLSEMHRPCVKAFTARFQPYSTFNFTNLRAWDIYEDRKICDLNGNLVLLLSDYASKKPFFTLLGEIDIYDSLKTLLEYAHVHNYDPNIRFVTQEATESIFDDSYFHIIEDRQSFDYIYSTDQLTELNSSLFKEKRNLLQRFKTAHPSAAVSILNIAEKETKERAFALLNQWEANKQNQNKDHNLKFESVALSRILSDGIGDSVFMTIVFDGDVMLGFGIDEILPNHHSISHFVKADIRHKGIYEFLNQQIATYLVSQDVKWWNWQQDLGIEGLRQVKLSYQPIHFLKKYIVGKKLSDQ